jgi:hypothetical protein
MESRISRRVFDDDWPCRGEGVIAERHVTRHLYLKAPHVCLQPLPRFSNHRNCRDRNAKYRHRQAHDAIKLFLSRRVQYVESIQGFQALRLATCNLD